ncbi:hypothetical protein [Paludisphaera rhizosphaerae]|uniref:hypothetical protein n=1 Tax=Paludisphaera rhizosphaerae TaxID=2711216 RepID=UPI0013EA5439|nr:hypothetical protein [Paludisphaera rhizosphaerae]
MAIWRTIRIALSLLIVSGLVMSLSGCGGAPSGVQEEVKVEPVKDKDGKVVYDPSNEASSAPASKSKSK